MALTKIDDRGLKTPIDLLDNEKIRFGNGDDLQIYNHKTTGAGGWEGPIISNHSGNIFYIEAKNGETGIELKPDEHVKLMYDGSPKLETKSAGVQITGQLMNFTSGTAVLLGDGSQLELGSDNDLKIYHTGSHGYIDNNTGSLIIRTNVDADVGGDIFIKPHDNETAIAVIHDNAVQLFYDGGGTPKLETMAGGVKMTGNVDIYGNQVHLYNATDTSDTYFVAQNTAAGNAGIKMKNSQGEWLIIANDNLRFYDADNSHESLTVTPSGTLKVNGRDDANANVLECYNDNGNNSGGFSQNSDGDGTIFAKTDGGDLNVFLRSDGISYFKGGSIGIGTDNPRGSSTYKGLELSGTVGGVITFSDDEVEKWNVYGAASEGGIYDRANTRYNLKWYDTGDVELPSGNLKVPNNGGIDFQNQTWTSTGNTNAEVLDNYEEGTFVPTLGGSSSDPTQSYATQRGSFVRIGNLIHISIDVQMAATGITAGSGTILLGSLPFAKGSHGTAGSGGGGQSYGVTFTAGLPQTLGVNHPTAAYMGDGVTYMHLMKNTTDGWNTCNAAAIANGSRIVCGASYITTA